MRFPATPESVRTARRFVAERVRACPDQVAANAVLLTSELCTNCVVHARGDYVLRVRVGNGTVRVEVADDDPDVPVQGRGRGLRIVEDVATRWGTELAEREPGKVVWFELRG